MKLAEALILRADSQKRIEQLRQRLYRSAKIQEGEEPPENPVELLEELEQILNELAGLIKRINKTNSSTTFQEGMTLTDALAERDTLALKRNILAGMIEVASVKQDRYSRSEVKFFSTIKIAEVQKQVNDLSKQYRELDSRIQSMNWQVELSET